MFMHICLWVCCCSSHFIFIAHLSRCFECMEISTNMYVCKNMRIYLRASVWVGVYRIRPRSRRLYPYSRYIFMLHKFKNFAKKRVVLVFQKNIVVMSCVTLNIFENYVKSSHVRGEIRQLQVSLTIRMYSWADKVDPSSS